MTEERFIMIQNGDLFTVRDTFENKPMGVFEFKEDEFPVYFCFHKIIDLLNELNEKWIAEFSLRETLQLELQRVENENEQLNQYILYLKSVLEDNEIWYNDGDVE